MSGTRRAVSLGTLLVAGSVALMALRRLRPGRFLAGFHANVRANFRGYPAPIVCAYDLLAPRLLGGFYRRVTRETADLAPAGCLLDVGSGPGDLAVELARAYPALQVVGVDVSREMVERARERVRRSGLGGQVRFEEGDVGLLLFPDASFDAVLSTFSMHHWPDPVRGLAEIHRVLRPGGVARIYDLAEWIGRFERRGGEMADLAARSPFGGGSVDTVVRVGPIPLVRRIELQRARLNHYRG